MAQNTPTVAGTIPLWRKLKYPGRGAALNALPSTMRAALINDNNTSDVDIDAALVESGIAFGRALRQALYSADGKALRDALDKYAEQTPEGIEVAATLRVTAHAGGWEIKGVSGTMPRKV